MYLCNSGWKKTSWDILMNGRIMLKHNYYKSKYELKQAEKEKENEKPIQEEGV